MHTAKVYTLPNGTVTFLFTDIEGSTKLWERDAAAMRRTLTRHDEILRGAIEASGGYVFKTLGDAFCAAFAAATEAVEAALAAQRALYREPWDTGGTIRVRMALHTGAVQEQGGDYFGAPVNRVARLLSAGHGGQILLSLATQELVRDGLPEGADLRDLGERHLKDLFRPERIFQLRVPDLPASFPPLKTLDARRNNLPLQPTPLVGREREVGEVGGRLRQEGVRLLTLTGPGGTGKTRLSLQAAAELLDESENGAFFVALAPIADPGLVASTIAGTLGVVASSEQALVESLKNYLRNREILFVLDNFEQVVDAAPLVGELLAVCPRLKILATSRIALRVYGEREYAVPPLALPDPGHPPPVGQLAQYEAVRLFIERARAVKADFEVTNESAPAVAEICARLDGLPLAIELAAARVKTLPPEAMLGRISNRLKLLKGGARDLPERQRTLRGAIDWSHDLLDEEERTLFRRLSVFAGGRTLEAVEGVCAPEGELDALDGIESMVDKSLLRQEEGPDEEPRFVMLETIHEYAREKLEESGEAAEIRHSHAGYFLALAEEAEPELSGPHQLSWFQRLNAEHDNFRSALGWLLGCGEVDLALRLGGALGLFWGNQGHHSEGIRWLAEAVSDGGEADPGLRAKALRELGSLLHSYGNVGRAEVLLEESLVLYRELGDGRGTAIVLSELGMAAFNRGDLERAETLADEVLALARQLDYPLATEFALMNRAAASFARGDLSRAEALMEECLESSRSRGDTTMVAFYLNNMGYSLVFRGEYERSKTVVEEALDLFQSLDNWQGAHISRTNLAMVSLGRDDAGAARRLAEESLTMTHESGDDWATSENLEILAGVADLRGQAARAARIWGAAEARRESAGVPIPFYERAVREGYVASSRSRLGEALWEEILGEGRAMSSEEVLSYALDPADGQREAR